MSYKSKRGRSGNLSHSTYNTTNTLNKSLSHQFTCNATDKETVETSLFSCSFVVHTIAHCLHPNVPNVNFIPITKHFPTHVSSTFYNLNSSRNACYLRIISNANSKVRCLNIPFQFNSIITSMFQYHLHLCMQKEISLHFYM